MRTDPIRVLVVEDNPADADLLPEILADAGLSGALLLDIVGCIAAARERLTQRGVEAVLLDLHLPDSDGIHTVNEVHSVARDMAIVVLTSTQDEAIAIEAVQAGAQDYLVKGRFDGSTLVRAVRYAVERQRLSGELDRLREEFAAVVAHDLRNPLYAARLHTQILIRQMEEKVEGTEEDASRTIAHAHQILANIQRISDLVDDLIDAARIELRRFDLEPARLSAARAVQALVEQLRPTVGARKLDVVIEGQPPDIDADPRRFDQILTNLVENAAKFSPDGSTIRITVRAADGGTAIAVSDEGMGIESDEIDKLFDRFYQARRARVKKPSRGLGLGLYITRGLVQAHRGSVSVDSHPGKGSRFTVWLPRTTEGGS